jgi:hypothetical protein
MGGMRRIKKENGKESRKVITMTRSKAGKISLEVKEEEEEEKELRQPIHIKSTPILTEQLHT